MSNFPVSKERESDTEYTGYAVVMDDPNSAPEGFWWVGAWHHKATADEIAKKHGAASHVVPISSVTRSAEGELTPLDGERSAEQRMKTALVEIADSAPFDSWECQRARNALGWDYNDLPYRNATPQPPVTPHRSMPGGSESSHSANGSISCQPCETGSGDMAAGVAPVAQSATEATGSARLLWLETLLKHCPHADLTWNDDADEGPLGWRLLVESCSRLDLRAPTLEALIDLGMKAEPDEDGDVVANATDATTDRKATDG